MARTLADDPLPKRTADDNAHREPSVLMVDEVAALLRVNRKTVYEAIQRGDIPGVRRIGHSIRVSRAAVLAWLEDGQARSPRSKRHS